MEDKQTVYEIRGDLYDESTGEFVGTLNFVPRFATGRTMAEAVAKFHESKASEEERLLLLLCRPTNREEVKADA